MWVNPGQLTQNSELFPAHAMDFLEEIHVKTSVKFMGNKFHVSLFLQSSVCVFSCLFFTGLG